MIDFEIRARDGFARLGRFSTPHGTLETPALLPVVHPDPRRQVIPPREIAARFGLRGLITSAYIAWRSPALRERLETGGIHDLLDFSGPVFTDSGAFQQHSYGRVEVRPEDILAFQERIGSDIATVLDVFVEPEAPIEEARRGVEETLARARGARPMRPGLLAVPVQGANFPELRLRSATEASPLADVLAVGGVVPLLEQYRFADLARLLLAARPGLAPEKVLHLFGTGHPLVFAFAALFGVDLFDSAAYHKFARRGQLLFPEGTVALDEVREAFCPCALCEATPLPTLSGLPPIQREAAIARHNLLMSAVEVRRVRQAIRDGTLWELAERRAAAHPALVAGLQATVEGASVFFPVEPESRRTFRATLATSPERPAVARFRKRLEQWQRGKGPFESHSAVPLTPLYLSAIPALRPDGTPWYWAVESPAGPVPIELTELYPIGCWVGADEFDRPATSPGVPEAESAAPTTDAVGEDHSVATWTARHVGGLLEWAYPAASEALGAYGLRGLRSRRTGRLREIALANRAAFRIGDDGVPRPTWVGAQLLHPVLPSPGGRVIATDDAAPFVSAGRSLFVKFVASVDPGLLVGASVLVVDRDDQLLAVGRMELAPHEMGRLSRGVAVAITTHARHPTAEASEEVDEAAP